MHTKELFYHEGLFVAIDEKPVRVFFWHSAQKGTSLSNDKKISDYKILTKTILTVNMNGFTISL